MSLKSLIDDECSTPSQMPARLDCWWYHETMPLKVLIDAGMPPFAFDVI
jgi:hypothetical protein